MISGGAAWSVLIDRLRGVVTVVSSALSDMSSDLLISCWASARWISHDTGAV